MVGESKRYRFEFIIIIKKFNCKEGYNIYKKGE